MNSIQQLCELLESEGLPGQEIVAGGGSIDNNEVALCIGPIEKPSLWLRQYNIPIREVEKCDELPGGTQAAFCRPIKDGDRFEASVLIPRNADPDDPNTLWSLWHEIGHAMDFITVRDGQRVRHDRGWYSSTEHFLVLTQYREAILRFDPQGPALDEYKSKPHELWAELVACAVMKSWLVPASLLEAVLPSLESRNIPVGFGKRPVEATTWKPEMLCQGTWCDNATRYATEQEAYDAGAELMSRWFVPTDHRATPTKDPVNYKFQDGRPVPL